MWMLQHFGHEIAWLERSRNDSLTHPQEDMEITSMVFGLYEQQANPIVSILKVDPTPLATR